MKALTLITSLVLLWGCSAVSEEPFERGQSAFDKGDYQEAMLHWRKAASEGNAVARVRLGKLYDDGVGVPQDYSRAENFFRNAADQGNAEAQSILGMMYKAGQGVPKSVIRAAEFLERAAWQGYPPAQNSLGVMYFRGSGVRRNLRESFFWLELAVRNGQPGAEHNRDFVRSFLKDQEISEILTEVSTWKPTEE